MTDFEIRLLALLERIAAANERGAANTDEILGLWETREARDLAAIADRDTSDRMKAEQARAMLLVWDATHPPEPVR